MTTTAPADLPGAGQGPNDSVIFAEGYQPKSGESVISAYPTSIAPGHFEAMGVRLLGGRFFTDADIATSPQVIIVDDRLARRFSPGANPIGKRMWRPEHIRLLPPTEESRFFTVVGVVNTVRMRSFMGDDERLGALYLPAALAQDTSRTIVLVVRRKLEPGVFTIAIRQEVKQLDPELPLQALNDL